MKILEYIILIVLYFFSSISFHIKVSKFVLKSFMEKKMMSSCANDKSHHEQLLERANNCALFTEEEISIIIKSFRNLSSLSNIIIDYEQLRILLLNEAHISFKKSFVRTCQAATQLENIISSPGSESFETMFQRILSEGCWKQANDYTKKSSSTTSSNNKPWAVLVTGLNGIRKTTSVNSPWFQTVLHDALAAQLYNTNITKDQLPDGSNSFFRQLDYIIATVANEEFRELYSSLDINEYKAYKNAIFLRYRNIAEIFGLLLIKSACKQGMNVLIETSGRDISLFEYINNCFISEDYNKLVINFHINDIQFAEESVDSRMLHELSIGKSVIDNKLGVLAQIQANIGGPYSSLELSRVLNESNQVVQSIFSGESDLGNNWYKASIKVSAYNDKPWTVQADQPNSQIFSFLLKE